MSKVAGVSAWVVPDSEGPFIEVRRGRWASMKIRFDEATRLADCLVDLVEQAEVTQSKGIKGDRHE